MLMIGCVVFEQGKINRETELKLEFKLCKVKCLTWQTGSFSTQTYIYFDLILSHMEHYIYWRYTHIAIYKYKQDLNNGHLNTGFNIMMDYLYL